MFDAATTSHVRFEVVIPAYNADAWIRETAGSALAIPEAVRVWVIDDGSQTPAAEVLEPLLAQHADRLRVVRVPNGGGQRARNLGYERVLEEGDSKWVVNLDHDDLLMPGITEAVRLGEELGAAAVIPDREEFDETGWEERKARPADIPAGVAIRPGLIHRPLAVFTATGLVLSRGAIESGVRFDSVFVVNDDKDVMRQAGRVGPIAICDQIGLRRRVLRDGSNLSGWRTLAGQVEDLRLMHERWYEAEDSDAWRAQALWILNQLVKRKVRGPAVSRLMWLFDACGWPIPLKLRWRLFKHRLAGRHQSEQDQSGSD